VSTTTAEASQSNDQDGVNFLDAILLLSEHLRLLVIGPLIAAIVAYAFTYTIDPTYTATTKLIPPQQQGSAASMLQSLGGLSGLAAASSGLKNPTDQYVSLLKSNSVGDELVNRFALSQRYKTQYTSDALQALRANVVVSSGKDGLITVTVHDKDPVVAAEMANAHVDALSTLLSRLTLGEAQHRRLFLENQLLQSRDRLQLAENALQAGGVNRSSLKANPSAAMETVARVQAQVAAQELRISSMRAYLSDTAPDVKQAQTELQTLRQQLAQTEKPNSSITADANYVGRYRQFRYEEVLFEILTKQYEMARLDEARDSSTVQVVDKARPPERRSKPRRLIISVSTGIAAFVLLLFGVLVAASARQFLAQNREDLRLARIASNIRLKTYR
jgi:tyrosine-protein kinase Etk/Wzc